MASVSAAGCARAAIGTSLVAMAIAVPAPLMGQSTQQKGMAQPLLSSRIVPVITSGGLRFRDLDRDGKVTPFEDWRLSPERRAADLVSRMTLEEKAGAMMYPVMGTPAQISRSLVNSVLSRSRKPPRALAEENNAMQEAAEGMRLAIPVTIGTDPRNRFTKTWGMSVEALGFSQWPDEPGFAASGDANLVRQFGDVVRQEYRATGFVMALSPQADLPSDPRWARVSGTFGEDPQTVGRLVAAYIQGAQGSATGLTRTGVAAIVKHFAGYGAAQDGWDSHSRYGRFATYPGKRFEQHVAAFRPAFRAGVTGVMPTYSILQLPGHPQVAGGFNHVLLGDILRRREGFGGLVLSDWSITEDCIASCLGEPDQGPESKPSIGKPWGVEKLSRAERVVLTIQAGVDQIGLDAGGDIVDSSPIVAAVRAGKLSQARIDAAVRRIMTIKFATGLFEAPYVDPAVTERTVGAPGFKKLALEAQHRSFVLLENKRSLLPVRAIGKRVFLKGVEATAARRAGFVPVDRLDQAELAIIRAVAPYQTLHPNYFFGRHQHEGDLDFKPGNEDLAIMERASAAGVPIVASIYLERPAILTNIRPLAGALIGNFGASDQALLDLVTGKIQPTGKLPFELPSSMAAVRAQLPDVVQDSARPLYPRGFGLGYSRAAKQAAKAKRQ